MIQSETIAQLATALAKAQALIKPAEKVGNNPHFGKSYATLAATWDACREALSTNGLCVTQIPVDTEPGRISLMTMLMHESGEYIGGVMSVTPQQNSPQAAGSALSYLRRYALSALVGIVADDDDDGNEASKPQAPRVESRSTRQPEQPTTPRSAPRTQPQRPASNDTDRAALVAEVAALATQAAKERVNVQPKKSLAQMTPQELTNHKRALEAALGLVEAGSPQR